MKEFYNSHIVKLRDVLWARDGSRLEEGVAISTGERIEMRVWQGAVGKRDLELNGGTLESAILGAGVDLATPFDAELIVRNPAAARPVAEALDGNRDYLDGADFNTLQWGGERSSARVPTHPARSAPMFFRENGMAVDLVDLYRGQTVFLVLNGPSLTPEVRERLSAPGLMTFAVNNGAHGFRPRLWSCVDDPTRFMESIWRDPTLMKFVPLGHFRKPIWDVEAGRFSDLRVGDFPNVIGYRRNEKFQADQWLREDTINWGNHGRLGGGRSVMLAALRICHLLGFRRVVLTGCDFRMDAERRYWFPERRSARAIRNNTEAYERLRGYFLELRPRFEEVGFEVVNATPGSALEVFPHGDLDQLVTESAVEAGGSTEGMYVDRHHPERSTG